MFFEIPNNSIFFSLGSHLKFLLLSSCYSQEEKHLFRQCPMIPSVEILKGILFMSLHMLPPPIPPSTCPTISNLWKGEVWTSSMDLVSLEISASPTTAGTLSSFMTNHWTLLLIVISLCLRYYLFCQEVRQATAYPAEEVTYIGKDVMCLGWVNCLKRSWRMAMQWNICCELLSVAKLKICSVTWLKKIVVTSWV